MFRAYGSLPNCEKKTSTGIILHNSIAVDDDATVTPLNWTTTDYGSGLRVASIDPSRTASATIDAVTMQQQLQKLQISSDCSMEMRRLFRRSANEPVHIPPFYTRSIRSSRNSHQIKIGGK